MVGYPDIIPVVHHEDPGPRARFPEVSFSEHELKSRPYAGRLFDSCSRTATRAAPCVGENYTVTGSLRVALTLTGVSQPKRSGLRPLAMPKNSSAMLLVISPVLPSPITIRSIDRMGETSAAVPVRSEEHTSELQSLRHL